MAEKLIGILKAEGVLKGSISAEGVLVGRLTTSLSDGEYERGYDEGYEVGETDGYTKGHTQGVEQGYADGYKNGEQPLRLLLQNKLTELDVPDGIESIAVYAFYNNTGLTRVSVPDSVTSIGRNAFYGASKVVSLTLGNGLTELPQDGFGIMRELVNLKLPDKLISIGRYAFRAAKLSEIYFPETLETVGDNAFWECHSLIFVHFGANIKTLGSGSFNSCSKLKTVVIHAPSTVCTLNNISAFTSTPIAAGTGYIYVPAALVEQYKSATNWSTYASQIRAIEDYPEITGGASA